ncbi:hypothetical protein KFK09_015945 [Dendrobium nobile]|uniref:Uncharacterized protein n=1 Tax=Dendrobium nobile TaxID=94219 RepID=A0A8T3B7F3_DENNO|nr:hypothetical protein KFK09_015945 [Dendrobium nobile]
MSSKESSSKKRTLSAFLFFKLGSAFTVDFLATCEAASETKEVMEAMETQEEDGRALAAEKLESHQSKRSSHSPQR